MQRATSNILSFATIASLSVGLACGTSGGTGGSGSTTSGTSESGTSGSASGSGSGAAATGTTSGATASGAGTTGASGSGGSACTTTLSKTVSFATDLMPIFQSNCSIGGTGAPGAAGLCHGDPAVPMMNEAGGQRQYFGPPTPPVTATTTPSLTAVFNGIVNQVSFDDPSMSIVTPDSLTNSFLWYKINGTEMTVENMNPDPCLRGDFGSCGSTMPLPLTGATTTLLPQADLDLICNWIVQGAKNN